LKIEDFTSLIPNINDGNFEDIALKLFRFQAMNNSVYRSYLKIRNIDSTKIASLSQIPFLPITFFKSHSIVSGNWNPEIEFSSSGTTGAATSRHLVWSLPFYLSHAKTTFEQFFGPIQDYHFLALLPSYLERKGSSLIVMMEHFIKQSKSPDSGFYLFNQAELIKKIESLRSSKKKVILWGVSFALLDLAEKFEIDLSHCIIIETGGMKGRRKEWIREELHEFLCRRFNVKNVGSEYGMTELMSQAYSFGNGQYQVPSSMKIFIRDINDPYQNLSLERVGAINIIDLANTHSCAFIETQDLGKMGQNGYFEVLGRIDNSDLRGCNLLVE
jgi:phenylacetate-coenzyme A ligase PaaK-like adenylate-forming protein